MNAGQSVGTVALFLTAAFVGCAHSVTTDSQQQAVERGLLPAIVLSDRPLPSWSVEERMARYRVPGVSIAVVDDGSIAWAAGYGVTRAGGAEAVSPSTLFQAASLVKVATATGALRLVQEKRLALDEDVNGRLRSWKIPFHEWTEQPVTLRTLLSHSAGVTGSGFSGYAGDEPLPDLRQILDGRLPANSPAVRIDTKPGQAFRYSGGGYLIVQQLMEDVTDEPFGQWMQRNVLDSVGMTHSTFAEPLSVERGGAAACGHGFDAAPLAHCWNTYPELAAAWLWSTPTDLARLGIALSDSLRGGAHSILEQSTAKQMLTAGLGGMGLGPGVHGEGDALYFDHSGWNRGFRAYLVMYPRIGKGIAVMANGDGAQELIDEIVRGVARTYRWPDFAPRQRVAATVDRAELESRAGMYEVAESGLVLSVRREGDHLILSTPRGSSYTFHPAIGGVYVAIEDGSELTFGDGLLHVWGMSALRRAH